MDSDQSSMSDDNKFEHITRTSNFFTTTMDNMEKMRDETWSDITLKVGCRSFFAHRLVLAAHSGYFKTLFLSNFSDSKSKEIDLSSVVEDADILEKVVKYMYQGDIEYKGEDFWEVARLASYFEMKLLMNQCQKKMSEHVSLHNCIEYYMFAHSHGYSHIDDVTKKVIEPRFHDYFVFQKSTLELRPGDLKLMLDLGFFKNCGNAQFLEFLGNWVAKGCTNQYVEVAKDILEYLDQETESDFTVVAHKTSLKSLEECTKNLGSQVNDSDSQVDKQIGDVFLNDFKRLVVQVQEAKEIPVDEEENVLFVLCERKKKQMLLDPKFEDKSKSAISSLYWGSAKKEWDSVFDIFVFRDRSNCWYHINTIESHPWWYEDKVLPFQRKNRSCLVVDSTLVFVTVNSKKAMTFDLKISAWSSLEFKTKNDHHGPDRIYLWLSDHEMETSERLDNIGNYFAVCSNEMYAVIVKPDVDLTSYRGEEIPVDVNGCYFKICKADVTNGKLTEVARTSLQAFDYKLYLHDLERFDCLRSSALVQINEASGDMLVLVYIDDDVSDGEFEKHLSFVVNVKTGSIHFFPSETNDQLQYPFHDLYIVEKEDCFLIVRNIDEDMCEVIAEYKFLSKEIVFREGITKPISKDSWFYFVDEPTESKLHNGGGSGLWFFDGYWNYSSSIKHIPLNEREIKQDLTRVQSTEENATKDIKGKNNSREENHTEGYVSHGEDEWKSAGADNRNLEGNDIDDITVEVNANVFTTSSVNRDRKGDINVNEKRIADGEVKEERNTDDSVSKGMSVKVIDTENKSVEGIPPPFTNVKCVREAKMDRAFLRKLKPVNMFLM